MKLKIHFSGLIGYVPTGNGLTALALNDRHSASREDGGHIRHEPFLVVRNDLIDQQNTTLDFEPDPNDVSGITVRADLKEGYQLEVDSELGSDFSYRPCRKLRPKGGSSETVMACPLEAPELMREGHTVSGQNLCGLGTEVAEVVALRVRLKAGTFQPIEDMTASGALSARKVRWVNTFGVCKSQYVPEIFEWESPGLPGEEVVLSLVPLAGGQAKRVTLRPVEGQPIVVAVSNEPALKQYCNKANKAGWCQVGHLGQLSRLCDGRMQTIDPPYLAKKEDCDEIEKFCEGVAQSIQGGRKPTICYGLFFWS